MFGRDLHEAREACRRFAIYGERRDLDKAWEIYYGVRGKQNRCATGTDVLDPQVFKKIEKQLPQLTTLDLQYVSPELLKARGLELAVPGASSAAVMRTFHWLTVYLRCIPERQAGRQDRELRAQTERHFVEAAPAQAVDQG